MSDAEIRAVVSNVEQLMDSLRANVDALQAILTDQPEVQGDQPAAAP